MITRERGSSGQHLTSERVNRGAYRIGVQGAARRAGKYVRVHSDGTLDITDLVRKVVLGKHREARHDTAHGGCAKPRALHNHNGTSNERCTCRQKVRNRLASRTRG